MFFLVGCNRKSETQKPVDGVEWYAFTESSKVGSGEAIVLQIDLFIPKDWSVETSKPHSQTLSTEKEGAPFRERIGEIVHERHRYRLRGADGSHVIEAVQLRVKNQTEEREEAGTRIFVDIGVDGPSSAVKGIVEDKEESGNSWPWIFGSTVLAGGLGWLLYRRRGRHTVLSASERARKEWREIRTSGVEDYDLAVALSLIVRNFVDHHLNSNLVNHTPLEARNWVRTCGLSAEVKEALLRIFEATDLLKYAREGGGGVFFNALEQDLELILRALVSVEE